jgi:hypothetical protein
MRQNVELGAALVVIVLLTAVYVAVAGSGPPGPGTLLGHWIGIVGFLLMLMTESLYSLRKQSRHIRWGRMQTWLSAHIFTGIVGPYMVFLHTGFRFAGVAGLAMWGTVVVVASGFVGRYVYTTLPRTSAGAEMGASQLENALRQAQAQLDAWLDAHPVQWRGLASQMEELPVVSGSGLGAILRQPGVERRYRRRWRGAVRGLDATLRATAAELGGLLGQRRTLQRQVETLATARRIMAIWHTMHVPLGLALFTLALVHVVAALYFSRGPVR